jgi:hypothetical protein
LAQVTCQICKLKEDKTLMCQERNKKYYHIELCHDEYLKERELQVIENQQWSELYEYIKILHNVITVPSRNTKRLQELRHGNDIKDGKKFKRYRSGISYDLILEAYILADEKIKWFIDYVLKNGNNPSDINGCITVMLDNGLNAAWKARQDKQKNDEIKEKMQQQTETKDMTVEVESNYKKKKKGDISNLL